MQGNGSREEHTRADRAGCKRGCSLYLHGWALHMSTAVCPVLFWNISLRLHNLALSHAHMCCKENVAIPHGVAEVDLMLAAGVRLSARTSLPCAVSCWSQGSPEQGKGVSASRKMWQVHLGSPKAATGGTGLRLSSPNGHACPCLCVSWVRAQLLLP